MNFEFSDEQNLLREQAAGFLGDNCPPSAVRAILEGDAPFDADLWKQIAELGWTATTIPEAHGGLGLSYLELCVIAEELGRAVAPVPYSSSVYLATEALLLAGSEAQKEAWLPRLAEGKAIGTFALSEGPGHPGRRRRHRQFRRIGGEGPGAVVAVRAGQGVLHVDVRQLVLDGLVSGDRPAERVTLHRVGLGLLERGVGTADLLPGEEHGGAVEQALRQRPALAVGA